MVKHKATGEMAKLYRAGRTMQEIADACEITKQAVQQRLASAGIKRRLKIHDIDKTTLEILYAVDRLSIAQIAKRFFTTSDIIKKALAWYGIPVRPRIKIGGTFVDIMRKLEVGASVEIIHEGRNPYSTLHRAAVRAEIKIQARSTGRNMFSVTRIGIPGPGSDKFMTEE